MHFRDIASASESVAATRARLRKVEHLSSFLQSVSTEELPIAVKFLSGELTQGKIGLGEATVRACLTAMSEDASGEPQDRISLSEANAVLGQIAAAKGSGSSRRRQKLLQELMVKMSADERYFLGRLILGNLRHGALEGIMMEAVAKATAVPTALIRRAAMLTGDLAVVASAARLSGSEGVRKFSLELFRPVQPMLAETADSEREALAKLGTAALEYKLDGIRVQIHKQFENVAVYTRQLNDVTANVPEIVELVRRLSCRQLILDGEVLALREDGRPHPFQTTMRRFGRKRDIQTLQQTLPVTGCYFDCLRLDDQILIDQPTTERQAALVQCVPDEARVPRLVTSDRGAAGKFLAEALAAGHEGIMAKSVDAPYEAGGRGSSWLKVKPAHSLDLVVLAAEWGSGRRNGWLSNLHLGAREPSTGGFAMIGKTFKGLTDEMLAWQTEELLQLESSRDGHIVYVQPRLVAEIAFNEVQQSPHYDSGYALRFARVKRYRPDKSINESDTIDTVAAIFDRQRQ